MTAPKVKSLGAPQYVQAYGERFIVTVVMGARLVSTELDAKGPIDNISPSNVQLMSELVVPRKTVQKIASVLKTLKERPSRAGACGLPHG